MVRFGHQLISSVDDLVAQSLRPSNMYFIASIVSVNVLLNSSKFFEELMGT